MTRLQHELQRGLGIRIRDQGAWDQELWDQGRVGSRDHGKSVGKFDGGRVKSI